MPFECVVWAFILKVPPKDLPNLEVWRWGCVVLGHCCLLRACGLLLCADVILKGLGECLRPSIAGTSGFLIWKCGVGTRTFLFGTVGWGLPNLEGGCFLPFDL